MEAAEAVEAESREPKSVPSWYVVVLSAHPNNDNFITSARGPFRMRSMWDLRRMILSSLLMMQITHDDVMDLTREGCR